MMSQQFYTVRLEQKKEHIGMESTHWKNYWAEAKDLRESVNMNSTESTSVETRSEGFMIDDYDYD